MHKSVHIAFLSHEASGAIHYTKVPFIFIRNTIRKIFKLIQTSLTLYLLWVIINKRAILNEGRDNMPYLLSLCYIALCLLIGCVMYRLGVDRKYSRKAVHILVGAEWFILHHTASGTVHFPLICIILTSLLFIEYKLRAIPAMSSDKDNAPGTVYYGISMSTLALASYFYPPLELPFGIGVLCTSFGDGLAGVTGQLFGGNRRIIGNKTAIGAIANFIASFLSALLISKLYGSSLVVWDCLMIALLSVGVELLSTGGTDNITVPISVAALSHLLSSFPVFSDYALYISAFPLVIALVYGRGMLSAWGTVIAAILGLASSFIGNVGFVLLLLYFALAKVTDKIKYIGYKSEQKIGESRGTRQVIANGAVAFLSACLYLLTHLHIFIPLYVTALCESLSDTAASGIGIRSRVAFDLFRWRRCSSGESGGVSLAGSLAAVFFAALFSFISYLLGVLTLNQTLIVLLSSLLGVTLDTFLGSLLQVRYRCELCGSITERSICCGRSTVLFSGTPAMTNSAVNLLSTVFSTIVCFLLLIL